MSRPTFTIQNRDKRTNGIIFEVLVDNAAGFDDFIMEYGEEILPGSKVDFADYRKVFRLRNDGSWEEYSSYLAEGTDPEASEAAAVAAVLDDLVPDSYIGDKTDDTEEGETV